MNIKLKYRPDEFLCVEAALRWADHSPKFNRVIFVEGVYFVVCNADAMRLVRAGYTCYK